jgi:hypothetical protein
MPAAVPRYNDMTKAAAAKRKQQPRIACRMAGLSARGYGSPAMRAKDMCRPADAIARQGEVCD